MPMYDCSWHHDCTCMSNSSFFSKHSSCKNLSKKPSSYLKHSVELKQSDPELKVISRHHAEEMLSTWMSDSPGPQHVTFTTMTRPIFFLACSAAVASKATTTAPFHPIRHLPTPYFILCMVLKHTCLVYKLSCCIVYLLAVFKADL